MWPPLGYFFLNVSWVPSAVQVYLDVWLILQVLGHPDPSTTESVAFRCLFGGSSGPVMVGRVKTAGVRGTRQRAHTLGSAHADHRPAMVSFDDFELADLLDPPVTVVAHDVSALGHAAAELLFARIQGDQSAPRKVVLPVHLVARGSGEVAP